MVNELEHTENYQEMEKKEEGEEEEDKEGEDIVRGREKKEHFFS